MSNFEQIASPPHPKKASMPADRCDSTTNESTRAIAGPSSMIESYIQYRVTSFAMRIARVFPLLLHQVRVVQYQYVHSATLLMQYRFQTVNQQLYAPDDRHYCAYCACAALIHSLLCGSSMALVTWYCTAVQYQVL
jgi:hypothetical protein